MTEESINKLKLQFDEGWFIKLEEYFRSEKADRLFGFLIEQSKVYGKGKILPEFSNLFRAFKECKYKDLSVIIVGQDPYYQVNPVIADGLAFSCKGQEICQPSLIEIHKEIERTVYNGMNFTDSCYNPDLTYLANQGVLLLNTSLTTPVYKAHDIDHHREWKPFMEFLFHNIINEYYKTVPIIAMGKVAQSMISSLNIDNPIFNISHPASASHKNTNWNCEDVFNKVNKHLKYLNNYSIKW